MTPIAPIQTLSRAAEPDDDSTLTEDVSEPAVSRAAQHLIVRHRMGQRFEIEALDIPHAALAAIGEQLEEAGISHALADPFIGALRRYIMKNGGAFSRAANAKPVRIHMVVADRMPKSRFDNAMTELACLGPREVKVEGATRVNVRATPSGTATSSNAADVDAMFAQVRGLYLWVRFEAPTKEDLDGLMSAIESTLAGVAQSIGGAMGAADFKKLLETLQRDGAMTPAVTALVNKLIQIQQAMGKDGKITLPAAELGALLKELGTMMDKAQGFVPPALIEAMMRSMADMTAANPAIAEFLSERGYAPSLADNDNISVDERLEAIMDKVAALAALGGLDPALAAELKALIEKSQADLKTGDVTPAALLDTLKEKLTAIAARGDIPQALMDGIGAVLPDITALRDSPQVAGAMPDLTHGVALLTLLEDIAAKIEKGEVDINALPPEMKALIEKMGGIETLMQKEGHEARIEALADAMAAKQATELSIAVQAAVAAMTQPDALVALPAPVQALVDNFVTQNPAIIERAILPMTAPMAETFVSASVEQKNDPVPAAKDIVTPLQVVTGASSVSAVPSAAPPAPPTTVAPSPPPPPAPAPVNTAPPPPVQKVDGVVVINPAHPALPTLIDKIDTIIRQDGKSAVEQAQVTVARLIRQDLDAIRKGTPVSKEQVEFTLKKIDTLLLQEKDPEKRLIILRSREEYKKLTENVPGVDKTLRDTPSKGMCGDPCPCDAGRDFSKFKKEGGAYTPEQILQARQAFEDIKKSNPNMNAVVTNDGKVTITFIGADGKQNTIETTVEEISISQQQNADLMRTFEEKGYYNNTATDDAFDEGFKGVSGGASGLSGPFGGAGAPSGGGEPAFTVINGKDITKADTDKLRRMIGANTSAYFLK